MPVWHKATQEWVKQGRLIVLGIAQEQHGDRCRLYAQWQKFDFPILHDPINLLGAKVVPLMLAIDEQGIVRAVGPKLEDFEDTFLNKDFLAGEEAPPPAAKPSAPDIDALQKEAKQSNSIEAWRSLGDGLILWHGPDRLDEAISAYSHSLQIDPTDDLSQFRLGVCFLKRHESESRQPGDFQKAADLWGQALETDPNQYIWRRRIQQYGPRLNKPYPFYDWMAQAQTEVKERGEEPVAIQFPLSGSEIAQPVRKFLADSEKSSSPDPDGLLGRDTTGLIEVEVAVVPSRIRSGKSTRVHIDFLPAESLEAHWNNEAEPLRIWVDLPEGWETKSLLLSAPQPEEIESIEMRHIDFGILTPEGLDPGPIQITAYALYYVCEGKNGTCQFLRKDIKIQIEIVK